MRTPAPGPIGLILLAALWGALPAARGQGVLRLDFEGAETSWRDAGGDARYTIDQQKRVAGAAQAGNWCEYLRVTANNGTYVYIRHDVGAARVIAELKPSVWVKANRPGVQMLARVVLPRSLDASNQPITTYIRGVDTARAGQWHQLRLDDLPKLLERQAIFLRTRLNTPIDTREAYIDNIVLNVYGGPGVTELLIDDLELAGFVGRSPTQTQQTNASPTGWAPAGTPRTDAASTRPNVELNGPLLLVDGHAFFARAIDHRGEPLGFLKGLGFNAVKLPVFPSPALLAEADRESLWLICPPPLELPAIANADSPGWNRILCWDLGAGLTDVELESTKTRSDQLRRLDPRFVRPITADVDSQLRAYSRHIDLLRASRSPLSGSLELNDYSVWLRERPKLARPGTALWTTIATQPPAVLEEQLALFIGQPCQASASSEQIRLLTLTAIAGGARGLCFESRSRLDANDPASRQRALTLELLNLELDLISPWCAGGTFVASVPGSDPEVRGAVLQTDRARLLLPLWVGRQAQMVPGQSAGNGIAFTVPGVPESCDAYELSPAGMRSLKSQRKTGGMRVTLEEFGLTSLVLLTHDALVLSNVTKKLEQTSQRAAKLARDLAAARLSEMEAIDRKLAGLSPPVNDAAARLKTAKSSLAQCDLQLAAGGRQYQAAHLQAERTLRPVRLLERAHWDRAIQTVGSPMSVPGASCFATLPQFWTALGGIRAAKPSLNILPAGDFESLDRLVQTGWRHLQHDQEGIETEAQLEPSEPHGGKSSLQLRAWATDVKAPPGLVESPPIWVETTPVAVETGQWVRIHGWVQVPAPIVGSVDALLIFDSLTGQPLAERIGETKGWQEFTLYRAAPRSGPLTVTFALTGLGVARIDDVTIEPLVPRHASPQPATQAPPAAQAPLVRRLPPVR